MREFKDTSNTYRFTNTDDLMENLSRKRNELRRAENKPLSYWTKKEIARLKHYIKQIEVELNARALQMDLL